MQDLSRTKFRVVQKIGQGAFGKIFLVEDPKTKKLYAMKLESYDVKVPQLLSEVKMYNLLYGSPGIPQIWATGSNSKGNYIVIDLLGLSLESLLTACGRRLSVKTVLMLADQMITSIRAIHKQSYIHRDIKPDNFVMGINRSSNKVYIIDFGLAKRYRDPTTGEHYPYREGLSLSGTARYASIPALSGIEQSRRDDMEGLGYVLVYLLKGSLPWQGVNASDKHEKHARICEFKKRVTTQELCTGLPLVFTQYLEKVKLLSYFDKPDYDGYRKLFSNYFRSKGYKNDNLFDWDERGITATINATNGSKEMVKKPKYHVNSNDSNAANTSFHAIQTPSKELLEHDFKRPPPQTPPKKGQKETEPTRKVFDAKKLRSISKFAKTPEDFSREERRQLRLKQREEEMALRKKKEEEEEEKERQKKYSQEINEQAIRQELQRAKAIADAEEKRLFEKERKQIKMMEDNYKPKTKEEQRIEYRRALRARIIAQRQKQMNSHIDLPNEFQQTKPKHCYSMDSSDYSSSSDNFNEKKKSYIRKHRSKETLDTYESHPIRRHHRH